MQSQFELLNEAEQAAAALHPIRSRLLECFREPHSAAEAARLVDMPRQRIGHHVRLLLRLGLLQEVEQRRRGAFTERVLQTTARAWAISPGALGAIGMAPDDIRDEFSSQYLAATAARTLRDVARLRELADEQGKRLATLTVETEVRFGSAAAQAEFAREAMELLAQLAARYHDDNAPEGRRFRFTLGGLPALPAENDGDTPDESETAH